MLLFDLDRDGSDELSEWRPEEYLTPLQPAVLRALHIDYWAPMAASLLRAVERFTGLTALSLDTAEPLPQATLGILSQLPKLWRLKLSATQLPAGIIEALLALQQLTRLELKGEQASDESLCRLSQLSCLRWLALEDVARKDEEDEEDSRYLVAPEPAAFPAGLICYLFSQHNGSVQVCRL